MLTVIILFFFYFFSLWTERGFVWSTNKLYGTYTLIIGPRWNILMELWHILGDSSAALLIGHSGTTRFNVGTGLIQSLRLRFLLRFNRDDEIRSLFEFMFYTSYYIKHFLIYFTIGLTTYSYWIGKDLGHQKSEMSGYKTVVCMTYLLIQKYETLTYYIYKKRVENSKWNSQFIYQFMLSCLDSLK